MRQYIKNNLGFLLGLIFTFLVFTLKFPYYIDAPGGINNIDERIKIDGYKSQGSFNITYIREYRATIPTLIISLFNKEWEVIKEEDVLLESEDINDYIKRDKLFMDEAVSNAIYVGYKKAGKQIKIKKSDLAILYRYEHAKTNLEVGDIILEVDGIKITNDEEIKEITEKHNIGDKLNIKVENDGKKSDKYATVIEIEKEKKLGILLALINEYETKPKVEIKIEENESGSSGGLIMALAIYNSLIKEDITNSKVIVGTGTIDINGNVGSIGGVEKKLKSAENANADIFLVPNGENYKEAIKLKKEKNYKIKVVGVSTFDEALKALKE